nr:DUF736 family protein [Bradyrhizobium sp. CCBAU 53380]
MGQAECRRLDRGVPKEGRDYLSPGFDQPSFNAPIYADLFDDEGGKRSSPRAMRP